MDTIKMANALAGRFGTRFARSERDAAWVTKRDLSRTAADSLAPNLRGHGIEATVASDCDDPAIAWVYASLDGVSS